MSGPNSRPPEIIFFVLANCRFWVVSLRAQVRLRRICKILKYTPIPDPCPNSREEEQPVIAALKSLPEFGEGF